MPPRSPSLKPLKSMARHLAAGTSGLLVAVAGYATLGGFDASAVANAPLAAAVAPVAREASHGAASMGAIISATETRMVTDDNTFTCFSTSLSAAAPATQPAYSLTGGEVTPTCWEETLETVDSDVTDFTVTEADYRDAATATVTWQPTTAPATNLLPKTTAAATAAAPVAAPAAPAAKPGMISSGLGANGRINLTLNRTAEVKTSVPVKRVSIGQPDIADVQPYSSNMILVTAKKPGTTQVIVWDDQDRSQSIDVSVEIPLDQLKNHIARIAPGANVEVSVANDQIVLRGQAPNLTVAKQVSDLAGAYGKVQNFVEVAGAQTVAVQVQFAEVSRSVTNDLGVSWAYQNGTSIFGNDTAASGLLGYHTSGDDDIIDGIGSAKNPGQFNIFGLGSVSGNPFSYFIKALRDNQLLRILQEPTLTTTSGEAASFIAGGEVPVPVPSDNGQIAIEYKEFGVRLKLTPVVLGNGKIRLVMEAESSELDYANGTTISGAAVPGLRTRRVQNTVELGEGQTISVAGLLDDSVTATKRSVPLLGDIPVLGQLFRSTRYQRRETELVILITPRLAGAMNPDQVTPLPGSGWRHPNELEQFAFGDMGGNQEADAVKDWNKNPSERGLKGNETQRNTRRALEPASISKANTPPPTFMGDNGFTPPEPDAMTTARD